jgi:hypothetical protein
MRFSVPRLPAFASTSRASGERKRMSQKSVTAEMMTALPVASAIAM